MVATTGLGLARSVAVADQNSPPAAQTPLDEAIRRVVVAQVAQFSGYRPGDLLTRDQGQVILEALAKNGYDTPDAKNILDRMFAANDYLPRALLGSPAGRKFMRQIARIPQGYDRVDRLSRIPSGQSTVDALIVGPDGDQLIAYMTETPGGVNLSKQLTAVPGGQGFDKPTDRIYNADGLIAALDQQFSQAAFVTP